MPSLTSLVLASSHLVQTGKRERERERREEGATMCHNNIVSVISLAASKLKEGRDGVKIMFGC